MWRQDLHEVEVRTRYVQTTFQVPSHLEFIKAVGSGAYGCVAAFKDRVTGEKIAVKKVTDAFHDLVDGKRILREVKLLQQFDHGNIIRIIDIYPPPSPNFEDIYIVTDLMETDLQQVIRSKTELSEEHLQYLMYQIFLGLAYLHSMEVLHRDLKPANILVNRDCEVKICDFGLARVQAQGIENEQPTDYVVTRWYRAPEVILLTSQYTQAIDVWAAGCVLGELILRKPLFPGTDYQDQVKKIVKVLGTPRAEDLHWLPRSGPGRSFLDRCPVTAKVSWGRLFPDASTAVHELIAALLQFDPTVRISARDSVALKFFEDIFEGGDFDNPTRPKPLDWSFDYFELTKPSLQNHVYRECANFHPEIIERDRELFEARGLDKLLGEDMFPLRHGDMPVQA